MMTNHLLTQSQIPCDSGIWHGTVLRDLKRKLEGDSEFPCVFSKNAFRKQLLKFIFVERTDSSGIQHLASGLKAYVDLSRSWDGSLDTAYPLIVAFSHECIRARTVQEYHAFGWQVLQRLHDRDAAPWPENVSENPESATWSMCFSGMALFCNMSSPAHEARRSRNLGEHFILVVNPRERFDVVAGNTPAGRRVRITIRNRIDRYDDIPHSPMLGHFGSASLEWRQYGLTEHNAERHDTCPFLSRDRHIGTANMSASSDLSVD
jgi:FPC/CPF motif-containing protein YcgG